MIDLIDALDRITAREAARRPRPTHMAGGHWLLGHVPEFARDGLAFYEHCERTAGIVEARIMIKRVFIVTDPALVGEVLVEKHRHFVKPYVLRRMKAVFGGGLLTSEGETWLHNRRLVQPAFQSSRVKVFADVARQHAAELADRWAAQGGVRDVYPELVEFCLNNLTRTMLGTVDAELAKLVRRLVRVGQRLAHAVANPFLPPPTAYPNPLRRELRAAKREMHAYLDRLIEERRRQPSTDFLGLLVAGRPGHPPLSPEVIKDETVTMLLAGHETAAAALIWALHLLATHPATADTLAEELDRELGGDAPSAADMDRLPRLRATLDEVLRLYPPTHRVGRSVASPVRIGGFDLPVGAEVTMPQWAVHRSARFFDDPTAFRPERWTDAFRTSLPRFAYFPFSGGPRTCVGLHLVWLEDAIALGTLAQKLRFRPANAEPIRAEENLTLVPAGERLELLIEPREPAVPRPTRVS